MDRSVGLHGFSGYLVKKPGFERIAKAKVVIGESCYDEGASYDCAAQNLRPRETLIFSAYNYERKEQNEHIKAIADPGEPGTIHEKDRPQPPEISLRFFQEAKT